MKSAHRRHHARQSPPDRSGSPISRQYETQRTRFASRVFAMLAAVWGWCISGVCASFAGLADFDQNGYVDSRDHRYFTICLSVSGPDRSSPFTECRSSFDGDADDDVDLTDFTAMQNARGHLPIPLKDGLGNVLTVNSDRPYNGRQTCGGCHDIDRMSNGIVHQQGRTDAAGNIVMKDDFYDDGRWWVRSAGMYGRWSPGGGGLNRQMAGKHNANESSMDMTAFYWAGNCGGCHVGGGGAEFDRDGQRLWDEETRTFGYEELGRTSKQVRLDGDYAYIDDVDGSLRAAPWNATGVAAPECLHCHRANRVWMEGKDMHREWRAEVLGTRDRLVDADGAPVSAYAAAGTAGQGWFSTLDTTVVPPVLQLDYSVGVANGSLTQAYDGSLFVPTSTLTRLTTDEACWGCHLPGGFQNKRGTVWFDERDIHYRKFTQRNDDTSGNDLPDGRATVCSTCHPSGPDHDFAKGDSPYAQFRNELDWADFRSCRECHLFDSPNRHPDAPDVGGGNDQVLVHLVGDRETGPMGKLACQTCHVPYALARGIIATDRSVTGTDIVYYTDDLLSSDPLNPSASDKSTWYPALRPKVDSDGLVRFFPQKMEVAVYWGDWDRNATPNDSTDDRVQPIILWRLREITSGKPLPAVADDNADGKPEINRPEEMLAYMQALKGNDHYGRPVAENPVLVKGRRVWFEDPLSLVGVNWFDPETSGAFIQPFEVFGLDHNVLTKTEAWGSDPFPAQGCSECHSQPSPVLDRWVLVDPFGEDGRPVYETVRQMTGLSPP